MATLSVRRTAVFLAFAILTAVRAFSQEASRGKIKPGVGESFMPPPIAPMPEAFRALAAADAVSREEDAITLDQLEEIACRHNPTLRQAEAQVEGMLGKAIQAGLWPNPVARYLGRQIGVVDGQGDDTIGEWQGGVIQQEFITGQKLRLQRAKYLERTRTAEWVALVQQYRVLNDVRMHWFRTLGQQELVGIQRELLKNSEDRLVTLREMYNLGQVSMADLHQANAMLQEQRLNLLMAENDYRQSYYELTALAGVEFPWHPQSCERAKISCPD